MGVAYLHLICFKRLRADFFPVLALLCRSAQFEYTILVTENGAEILTPWKWPVDVWTPPSTVAADSSSPPGSAVS